VAREAHVLWPLPGIYLGLLHPAAQRVAVDTQHLTDASARRRDAARLLLDAGYEADRPLTQPHPGTSLVLARPHLIGSVSTKPGAIQTIARRLSSVSGPYAYRQRDWTFALRSSSLKQQGAAGWPA
jgi:hypothetical protein